MTTTVTIIIEGNEECTVSLPDGSKAKVMPGRFTKALIHGSQQVSVIESRGIPVVVDPNLAGGPLEPEDR